MSKGSKYTVQNQMYLIARMSKESKVCCDISNNFNIFNCMHAHIRSVHTKNALLCMFCPFSTYNLDSLNRHEREQHK